MGPDRLQLSRLELKYRINEDIARGIRDFVGSHLDLDENGVGKPNLSYPVHSLYLDSDDLRTYWDTINGLKNRFKLRIRYYDQDPDSPVFFEIKRRMNEAILKQRGGVRREAARWLLAGHLPDPSHLVVDHPKHLVALQRFSYLMLDLRAKPKVHVSYLREAWVSTQDNSIRVTMDRQVQGAAEFSASLGTETSRPVATFGQWTILELKFTGRFPNWFRDLVQTFGLLRCAAAKYADSVPLLGEDRLGCGSDLNGKRLSVGDRDVSAGGRRAQVFGSALADE